jgi:hypothetical protein
LLYLIAASHIAKGFAKLPADNLKGIKITKPLSEIVALFGISKGPPNLIRNFLDHKKKLGITFTNELSKLIATFSIPGLSLITQQAIINIGAIIWTMMDVWQYGLLKFLYKKPIIAIPIISVIGLLIYEELSQRKTTNLLKKKGLDLSLFSTGRVLTMACKTAKNVPDILKIITNSDDICDNLTKTETQIKELVKEYQELECEKSEPETSRKDCNQKEVELANLINTLNELHTKAIGSMLKTDGTNLLGIAGTIAGAMKLFQKNISAKPNNIAQETTPDVIQDSDQNSNKNQESGKSNRSNRHKNHKAKYRDRGSNSDSSSDSDSDSDSDNSSTEMDNKNFSIDEKVLPESLQMALGKKSKKSSKKNNNPVIEFEQYQKIRPKLKNGEDSFHLTTQKLQDLQLFVHKEKNIIWLIENFLNQKIPINKDPNPETETLHSVALHVYRSNTNDNQLEITQLPKRIKKKIDEIKSKINQEECELICFIDKKITNKLNENLPCIEGAEGSETPKEISSLYKYLGNIIRDGLEDSEEQANFDEIIDKLDEQNYLEQLDAINQEIQDFLAKIIKTIDNLLKSSPSDNSEEVKEAIGGGKALQNLCNDSKKIFATIKKQQAHLQIFFKESNYINCAILDELDLQALGDVLDVEIASFD